MFRRRPSSKSLPARSPASSYRSIPPKLFDSSPVLRWPPSRPRWACTRRCTARRLRRPLPLPRPPPPCLTPIDATRRPRPCDRWPSSRSKTLVPRRGAAKDAFFGQGVSDELTSRLTSVAGVRVLSTSASREYRTTTKLANKSPGSSASTTCLPGTCVGIGRTLRMPTGQFGKANRRAVEPTPNRRGRFSSGASLRTPARPGRGCCWLSLMRS